MEPPASGQRVVQLTFHKCGSQWVRDVLTAPEVQACTGIAPTGDSNNILGEPWPAQPPGTFLGPLYNATPADWEAHRQPGDRAILVLRDPRDRLVSWMYSAAFSHRPEPSVRIWRELLLPMNNHARVLLSMVEFGGIAPVWDAWSHAESSEHTFITTYEKLVQQQGAEFRRIVDFLGWNVPDETLNGVIDKLSFAKRSGRARGEENVFSHYRKGVAGDWRRYFDREMGARWEERMPGLLARLGYENDDRWFEALPERAEVATEEEAAATNGAPDARVPELEAAILRVREEVREERDILMAAIVRAREKNAEKREKIRYFRGRAKQLRKLLRNVKKNRFLQWARRLEKARRRRHRGGAA